MAVNYGSLPFDEAISFFRDKVSLPTEAWTDIWQGAHDRAFVVAGANTADIVSDFRSAVDKAISKGTTLTEFQQDFDAIVARHGWSYNGGRGWRTRVIFDTNLRTAHMAGRYKQMRAVSKTRPWWQYKHSDYVEHPRPEHQSWDGLILRYDDPWWQTHYPPNGWGCKCRVSTLSDRDMIKLGKAAPDKAPPLNLEEQQVGKRSGNPSTIDVPAGIDPGWAYAPGHSWFPNLDKYDFKMSQSIVKGYADDGIMQRWFDAVESRLNTAKKEAAFSQTGDKLMSALRKAGRVSDDKLPLAILNPSVKAQLEVGTHVIFISEDTLLKQLIKREGQQHAAQWYVGLQDLLDNSAVVKNEHPHKVIYVNVEDEVWFSVVKATRNGKEAYLVSLRKSNIRELRKKLTREELIKLGVA